MSGGTGLSARLGRAFLAMLGRRRFEDRMADEMADHLAHRVDDLVREGLDPEAAMRQARLEFGSIEGAKEAGREARRLDLLDELVRNLRHAARAFGRVPVLTFGVIATLGLGIGANVAVWSVVDSVLLSPLPYPDPDDLVLIETQFGEDGEIVDRSGYQDGRTWQALESGAEHVDLAVFSDWPAGGNVATGSHVDYLSVQQVGAGFFRVLGTPPMLGRAPTSDEDVPGGPAVAVLAHDLWQRLFDGDRDVLGRTLLLRGAPHEVIGVMPESFRTRVDADLWTPLRPTTTGEGEGTNYAIVGRLRSGANWAAADAEVRAIGADLMVGARSEVATSGQESVVERWLGIEPLQGAQVRHVRSRLMVAWAAALAVLIVACINVAGLLLAHAARRTHEIATRMALGGGRAAILRQLLTESMALSILGAVVGLGIGGGLIALLSRNAAGPLGLWQPIGIDLRVVLVAIALAGFAVVLTGLYPAVAASRIDLRTAQRSGDTKASSRSSWVRRGLVVAQLASVVALLVGAGLMVRTLLHLERLESGFDPRDVVAATVSLDDARFDTVRATESLLTSVAERLRAEPEIASAAAGLNVPYERPLNFGVQVLGQTPDQTHRQTTNLTYVTPGYFATLGIRVLRGRDLDDRDRADAAPVAVVNRAFADAYLGDRDPIGLRIATAGAEREIVGVVADTQQVSGWGERAPIARRAGVFVPVAQTNDAFLRLVHGWFQPSWVVRGSTDGARLAERLRAAVAAEQAGLPLADFRTMETVRDEVLVNERLQATLLSSAAIVTLLLAAIGLGGLIASMVTERTRELGIRMALGASRARTLGSATMPGLRLSALGLVLGLGLAAASTGALRAFVYGIDVFDRTTYVGVAALLLSVALVASVLPALRLLRLDPARVLRSE